MNQNYLMVNELTNIIDNVCVWDGNTSTWTPPANYLMLIQAITPAMVWMPNADKTDWVLTESIGEGQIGFVWNGVECVTNQPKPTNPPVANDPISTGTQDV